jgi:hypothetical protein
MTEIKFETDAQRAAYERVADLMTQMFGEMAWQAPDEPSFSMTIGSAVVTLRVERLGDDDAFVNSYSWVVTGVEKSPELYLYLLRENLDFRFGAFGVDDEGDIMFRYGIVGSSVDKEELRAAALAVAQTADKYDDEIIAKYGGMSAKDRMGQSS